MELGNFSYQCPQLIKFGRRAFGSVPVLLHTFNHFDQVLKPSTS